MTNTATPNQPLSQHPLPLALKQVLGAGSTFLTDVQFGQDYLLVPPPAASPNGAVVRLFDSFCGLTLINNDADAIPDVVAPLINFALVYKTATEETILGVQSTGILANATVDLTPDVPILVGPTDRGIFLRRIVEVADVPSIQTFCNYLDIRHVTRGTLSLTEAVQELLAGVKGKARLFNRVGEEDSEVIAAILNFDSVDHDIEISLSDGVTSFVLSTAITVLANDAQNVSVKAFLDASGNPVLLEDFSISARILEPLAGDGSVQLLFGYTDTNLAPVRTDQGGAF